MAAGNRCETIKAVFVDAVEEFDRGYSGLTLLQSRVRLLGNLHPRGFQRSETWLQTLAKCGAGLLFALPHAGESARLTVFDQQHLEYLIARSIIEIDEESSA